MSPAFLASDFIRTEELPRLLGKFNASLKPAQTEETAEGVLILPILLRPCLIDMATFEMRYGPSESNFGKLSDFQYVPKKMAMNGLPQFEQDKQLEFVARSINNLREKQTTETNLSKSDEDKLDKLLLEFLGKNSRWWFNSVRIQNWGGKQEGYKGLATFSSNQIGRRLEKLAGASSLESKFGKKSQVYKSK